MLSPSELAEKYGLTAKKSLGQNFLFDLNITRKIVKLSGDISGKTVVEIGSGPCGLTQAILEAAPKKLIAIEYDSRAINCLEDLGAANLEILNQDALRINLAEITEKPAAIIANLPYNIGTKLLTNWFSYIEHFEFLALMFQKEVAERLIAKTNSANYGRLSVMTQWLCNATILFDVPPEAFTPRPKVTSSVVLLKPHKTRIPANRKILEKLLVTAFGKRRKMLRASLKNMVTPEQFAAAGISPESRPQELTVEQFCALSCT